MECLLDYSLCNQTVTLYGIREGALQRQVLHGVMYQHWQSEKVDASGKALETGCLLIVPGQVDLKPGDRVYPGVGPQITKQEWTGFLPVRHPGLAQVSYVKPYTFEGAVCHTEAGREVRL